MKIWKGQKTKKLVKKGRKEWHLPDSRLQAAGFLSILPVLHSLMYILKESHNILLSEPSISNLLPPPPSIMFCHSPNLCQLLTRTNLDPWPPCPIPGSCPYQRTCCKTCPIHNSSKSPAHLTYPIHIHAIVSSSNLIYLLTSTQCDALYMGEKKNNFSTRISKWEVTILPLKIQTVYLIQS